MVLCVPVLSFFVFIFLFHALRLYLKRALPDQYSKKIEHFLTSENVLIQFKNAKDEEINEPNFNEEKIRNYFQTYGNILNLYLLKNNRCVIEYDDYGKSSRIIFSNFLKFDQVIFFIVKLLTIFFNFLIRKN